MKLYPAIMILTCREYSSTKKCEDCEFHFMYAPAIQTEEDDVIMIGLNRIVDDRNKAMAEAIDMVNDLEKKVKEARKHAENLDIDFSLDKTSMLN